MDVEPNAVLRELRERHTKHTQMTRELEELHERGGTGREVLDLFKKRAEITKNLEIITDLFYTLDRHLTTGGELPREWK